ncbi:hypothetical protein EJB05_03248, partial [Eragrostis curvula]
MVSHSVLCTPLQYIHGRNISDAVSRLLDLILQLRGKKVIYLHGWSGFGVTPVLRSMVQKLSSTECRPELCHHRLIYIDCSEWKSRRSLQRKIAEELKFDQTTMNMFDKQDEEDDFSGVDQVSRDLINDVSIMIDKTLREHSFIIIFLNGSDDELDLIDFGVPPFSTFANNIMIWSFKRRPLTLQDTWKYYFSRLEAKLRFTPLFVYSYFHIQELTPSEFGDLLHEEAASIVARHPCIQGIDLTMVKDCCLYEMFLCLSVHRTTEFSWAAHASNYWICDGIIKGDQTKEISSALHPEIRWECDPFLLDRVCKKLLKFDAPFLVINDDTVYNKKPCRWVSLTSKNLKVDDRGMKIIMKKASTLFVAFERTDKVPAGLPDGLFKYSSNLGVLVLFYCAFSFTEPPFLQCRGLRFLGLDHCINNLTTEGEGYCIEWAFLHSLWVLDLRYTDWDEILAEEKIDLMANLMDLNIEGLRCWQFLNQLQTRLPYLRRLRIIRPTQQEKISADTSISFVERTKLEILDLSGNSEMKKLPTNLSNACVLQVLVLDGCDGLENVDAPTEIPSSLTSFSLDSYGPAHHGTSSNIELPPESSYTKHFYDQDKKDVKTIKISLQGCKQLSILFLRGLSNLMELDLSGTALTVLDFGSMVVDVPRLKRLFLLGCGFLRAIKWGSILEQQLQLELLCIDTRPGTWTRPSPTKHDPSHFQVHAVLADVRLARSLWTLAYEKRELNVSFDIHVPSSGIVDCETLRQPEAISNEMTKPTELHHHCLANQYDDVLTEIRDTPTPIEAFPEPPAGRLDSHVEINCGGCILETELTRSGSYGSLGGIITEFTKSLHVHDASINVSMPAGSWTCLKWCRMERFSGSEGAVFSRCLKNPDDLEIIWVSEIAMARCVWINGRLFASLRHLNLRSCPRLEYALPLGANNYSLFPSLKTIHVVHCGDLRHVFALNKDFYSYNPDYGMLFPALAAICLHDLPKLMGICEVTKMFTPNLQTVKIRGCFNLRRLPTVGELPPTGCVRWWKPAVEVEKDVWDALEWDGMDARHHPSYYEPPVHSRYYRKRRLLRGSLLRAIELSIYEAECMVRDCFMPAKHGEVVNVPLLPRPVQQNLSHLPGIAREHLVLVRHHPVRTSRRPRSVALVPEQRQQQETVEAYLRGDAGEQSKSTPSLNWSRPEFVAVYATARGTKLAVEVLRIGVSVGVKEPTAFRMDGKEVVVGRDAVEMAVRSIMDGGEEGEERRRRAAALAAKVRAATVEGRKVFVALKEHVL